MKIKLLILGILALFILTGLASAEVTEYNNGFYGTINDAGELVETSTQVTDFHAIGFVCANDDCSNVNGTLWSGTVQNSGNDNQMMLKYPTAIPAGNAGYGVYFYKEGYFPFEAKVTYFGTWTAPTADNYFTRKENCVVNITDLMISHYGDKIKVNATLSSDVSSPVSHAGPLNYVPDSIKHLYAVDAKVTFRLTGPETAIVVEDVNLMASEHERVYAEFGVIKAGQYHITVESGTDDDKCINSIPLIVHSDLLIEDNRTNVTLPTIAIMSPEAKIYTNKTILVNLRSTNATSVYYNWNGVNVTYNAPIYITFNEGRNTLTAYAVNDVTIAKTEVTFFVNTTIPGNESDTTAPASVSGLTLTNRQKNSLSWSWNNPSDIDFAGAIVYINGVNVANVTSGSYTASGLSTNTEYTITIHTKDFTGNVNSYDVSNTGKTLSSSNGGGDNEDDNEPKKKLSPILPVENDEPIILGEDEDIVLSSEKKKSVNWLVFIMLLLFIGSIILLILLLVIASRRK